VPDAPQSLGIHLRRTTEKIDEIEALASLVGGRVGVGAVLHDLDRQGRRTLAPGRKVHRAWTWDRADRRDERWWPQGVSTSADATPDGLVGRGGSRSVVAVAWYAKHLPGEPGRGQGARVSFFDLRSRRYRHVLLVVPRLRDGVLSLAPLRVHAGGIVWAGDHLHVAATAKGLMSARLDDVLRLPASPASAGPDGARTSDDLLEIGERGVSAFGYTYVLPVRFGYEALTDDGVEKLRYSFASLDRASDPPSVLVGEYGRGRQTTRIARFPIDPATGLLVTDDDGRSTPLHLDDGGARGSQGIAVAGGTSYVTVSRGPRTPGSLVVGSPGRWREHRWALPMGPEDMAYWPERDELWTATEHPRRRWIVSVRRSRLGA